MTRQRLTDLAIIALESAILEKIQYGDTIEESISMNTKRMMLFKWQGKNRYVFLLSCCSVRYYYKISNIYYYSFIFSL
jgi:hypothetical protein